MIVFKIENLSMMEFITFVKVMEVNILPPGKVTGTRLTQSALNLNIELMKMTFLISRCLMNSIEKILAHVGHMTSRPIP